MSMSSKLDPLFQLVLSALQECRKAFLHSLPVSPPSLLRLAAHRGSTGYTQLNSHLPFGPRRCSPDEMVAKLGQFPRV